LAYFAERMDSYAFYSMDVWVRSLATMGIAILSLSHATAIIDRMILRVDARSLAFTCA